MIYPDRFPENQKFDNSKEKEFYARFKRELPPDWDMFYSFKFKMPGVAVREIDYIIISPLGVFLVELKNARFKFLDGVWWIYDARERNWKPHKKSQYSGPIEQVLSGIDNFVEFLKINHHEILPIKNNSLKGLVFLNKNEAAQINRDIHGYELIIFHRDLERFKLDDLIIEYSKRLKTQAITEKQRKIIREIILLNANYVPGYQIRREEQRKVIFALTSEQLVVIDQLNKEPRMLISGVPGSGKTLLALRALEILESLSKKTLFVAPTIAMAFQFMSHTEDFDHLTITTFAEVTSSENLEDLYDFLVIEESQALPLDCFTFFDRLLIGGLEKGNWLVFQDEGQVVESISTEYWKKWNPKMEKLSINIRNPKEIFETACILGRKPVDSAMSAIPDAINVKFLSYHSRNDEIQKLYELINYGVLELGLSPEEIVILAVDSLEDSGYTELLHKHSNLSRYTIDKIEDGKVKEGKVGFSRIAHFIGLETSFIILAGLDNVKNDKLCNLYYLALTRSNYAAAVLFDEKIHSDIENLFQNVQ
jgi:hypothetical protein